MNQKQKRISLSTLMGGILGIFCILGVGYRIGIEGNLWFLLGMWYNRVVMGLLIGFSGTWIIIKGEKNILKNAVIRGLLLGLIVTSAIFLTTELRDPISWIAGIIYGIIIDSVTTWYIMVK